MNIRRALNRRINWRTRDPWRRLQQRWPLVTRKWAARDKGGAMTYQRKEYEAEIEKLAQGLDRILPKFIRVKVGMTPGETYRCQVEFEREFIHQGFIQGNDQVMIGFIAQRLSRQIEMEIKRLNWRRFPEDEPRRYVVLSGASDAPESFR